MYNVYSHTYAILFKAVGETPKNKDIGVILSGGGYQE